MPLINYARREISFKVVYYGTGLGGKTTNLEYVHGRIAPHARGELISLASDGARTLLFDFLPVELGRLRGFRTRFHLYSVPGQRDYNGSRRRVLHGVDGLVFVADSDPSQREGNMESMENLHANLDDAGLDPRALPFVIQYNKRDLRGALPVEELREMLLPDRSLPEFEAVAIRGKGVFETLGAVSRSVLSRSS